MFFHGINTNSNIFGHFCIFFPVKITLFQYIAGTPRQSVQYPGNTRQPFVLLLQRHFLFQGQLQIQIGIPLYHFPVAEEIDAPATHLLKQYGHRIDLPQRFVMLPHIFCHLVHMQLPYLNQSLNFWL